jgi:uncharacterized protein (DUF2147 family)
MAEQDVVGFWKIMNDKTGKTESLIAVYEYQGQYYGRLIATMDENGKIEDTIYDPKNRAPGVEGDPFYVGMDIIWGLKKEGTKYKEGKILDPKKGKLYSAEMWPEEGKLVLRGKVWVFGENEEWLPATDRDFPPGFKKPDLTQFVPVIPQAKKSWHSQEAKAEADGSVEPKTAS